MLTEREVGALTKPIGAVVREFVAKAVAAMGKRIDQLEARFAAIPVARDGRDGLAGNQGEKGKDGRDGVDGKDGLGFDDLAVDYDGERELAIRFQRGTEIKAFNFTLPIVLDRGVWRENHYEKGDGVTWAGSFWICQRATDAKPDAGNGDFRLAVKRGRDGKDGK